MKRKNYKEVEDEELEYGHLNKDITENPNYSKTKEYLRPKKADYFGQDLVTTAKGVKTAFMSGQNTFEGKKNKVQDFLYNKEIKGLESLIENAKRERIFGQDDPQLEVRIKGYEKSIENFNVKLEENVKQQEFVKANYKNYQIEMDNVMKQYNNPVNKVIMGELGLNMLRMASDPAKAVLFASVHGLAPIVGAKAGITPMASEFVADLVEGTALDYDDQLILGVDRSFSSSVQTGVKEAIFGLGFGLVSDTIKGRGVEELYDEIPTSMYKNIINNGKEQAKNTSTTKSNSTNGIINNKLDEANITGNYSTKEQMNTLLGIRDENFKVTDEIVNLNSYVDRLYKIEDINVQTDSGIRVINPNLEIMNRRVLGDFEAKKPELEKVEGGAENLIKEKKIENIESKLDILERMEGKEEDIKMEQDKLSDLGVAQKIEQEVEIKQPTPVENIKGKVAPVEVETAKIETESLDVRGKRVASKIQLNEKNIETLKLEIKDVRKTRNSFDKASQEWKDKDIELDQLVNKRKKTNRELKRDDKILKEVFQEAKAKDVGETKQGLEKELLEKITAKAPQEEIDIINTKLDKIEQAEFKAIEKRNKQIAKELDTDVKDIEEIDDAINELIDLEETKFDPTQPAFDIGEDIFKGLEEELAKFTDEIKYEEVRKEYDNDIISTKAGDLFNFIEKTEARTKKGLTPKNAEKLATDYFRGRVLNQYNNYLTRSKIAIEDSMTFKRADGNIADPKKILTESHLIGNRKTLTKLALGIELPEKETLNVFEYEGFLKNLEELTSGLFEGRKDLTYEDAIRSMSFDRSRIFKDGLKSWRKLLDSEGNLDLDKVNPKMWKEVKSTFTKNNKDFLSEIEMERILNRLKIGWTRPDSGFKGTSVHAFDDIVNMKFITKEQQDELVKRYMANSNVFFDKAYKKIPNALALTETLGYDSKKNLDSIFQFEDQGDFPTKLYSRLYGTSVNSKTTQKSVQGQIDNSMDELLGFSTKFTPNIMDKAIRHTAKVSTIALGVLEPLTELAVQFNKVNSLAPQRTIKTLYKTVNDTVQTYFGLKKFSDDPRLSKYMKDHIGSVQGIYLDIIDSGFNDISGSKSLQVKEAALGKRIYNKGMHFTSKLNFIKGIDNIGDKLSILRFNDLMNDMYSKVGYDEIMTNSKYDFLASKMEMFGITKEMFDKMSKVEYNKEGVKIFEDSVDLSTSEKKLAEEFMNWGFNETAYTKPDTTFSASISNIEDPRTRAMIELQLFFKKTMFAKLMDFQKISVQHNAYAGLGKNFNYSNISHLGRMGFGISTYLIAMELNNYGEELYYGYDPSLRDNEFLQFMNDWGFYTIIDASGISRTLGKIAGAKDIGTVVGGVAELTLGKFPVRTAKRIFGDTKKKGRSGKKRGGKIGRK